MIDKNINGDYPCYFPHTPLCITYVLPALILVGVQGRSVACWTILSPIPGTNGGEQMQVSQGKVWDRTFKEKFKPLASSAILRDEPDGSGSDFENPGRLQVKVIATVGWFAPEPQNEPCSSYTQHSKSKLNSSVEAGDSGPGALPTPSLPVGSQESENQHLFARCQVIVWYLWNFFVQHEDKKITILIYKPKCSIL